MQIRYYWCYVYSFSTIFLLPQEGLDQIDVEHAREEKKRVWETGKRTCKHILLHSPCICLFARPVARHAMTIGQNTPIICCIIWLHRMSLFIDISNSTLWCSSTHISLFIYNISSILLICPPITTEWLSGQ